MHASRQPHIVASADVPWQESAQGSRFGIRYRHLTAAAVGEGYHVGVAIEELQPGMQSNPAHYHIFEEEHVFILEGSLTLRLGDERHSMEAGGYACFPAGQKAGHCFVNEGVSVCRYVILGENDPNEVAVYTDTGKVLVRSLGRRAIFDMRATRGYWDGEDTGAGQPAAQDAAVDCNQAAGLIRPISTDAIEWRYEKIGHHFGGRSQLLTSAVMSRAKYHVGVRIEAPDPGKRLAPLHYHMVEEEHALILEGEVTLVLGGEHHVMKPGDYMCFPAGEKIGHRFVNSGTGPCRYLMIGENSPHDVCVYPDSNKLMVRALQSEDDVFDMAAVRPYWHGEAE